MSLLSWSFAIEVSLAARYHQDLTHPAHSDTEPLGLSLQELHPHNLFDQLRNLAAVARSAGSQGLGEAGGS